jgi:hypothetical protein
MAWPPRLDQGGDFLARRLYVQSPPEGEGTLDETSPLLCKAGARCDPMRRQKSFTLRSEFQEQTDVVLG